MITLCVCVVTTFVVLTTGILYTNIQYRIVYCNHVYVRISKTCLFFIKNLYPLTNISLFFPQPKPLATTILFSVSRSLAVLDSTNTRDHRILPFSV